MGKRKQGREPCRILRFGRGIREKKKRTSGKVEEGAEKNGVLHEKREKNGMKKKGKIFFSPSWDRGRVGRVGKEASAERKRQHGSYQKGANSAETGRKKGDVLTHRPKTVGVNKS